jgi:hypothetical protein
MSKQMFSLPFRTAGKWLRAHPAAERMVRPTTLRVVEEQIPTIDELGNRRTLIRIRTLARVEGPMGLVEIEQDRRHTLPGFGHVYPIADNEYIVFHGRMKLRVDPEVAVAPQQWIRPNAPSPSEQDVEHVLGQLASVMAPAVHGSWRRKPFPLYAVFILVLLTIAVWTLHPRHQPPPPFSPLTPAIGNAGSAPTPNEAHVTASPATLLRESQPMGSPTEIPPVNNRDMAAYRSVARVALAIRPWGVVYINGKRTGISPPIKELTLTPGRYKVEIRNDTFQPHRESIDLRNMAKTKIAHDFNKAAKAAARKTESRLASTSRPHTRFLSEEWPR